MFGIFKRKKAAVPVKRDVAIEVETFILEYCEKNNINMDKLLLQGITGIENDEWSLEVVVRVAVPQILIGKGGQISRDLSKRMSKSLDKELRLQVRV